jgi:hypothetical protein
MQVKTRNMILPTPQVLHRNWQPEKILYSNYALYFYTLGKKVCYSAKNPKADGKMSSRFGA